MYVPGSVQQPHTSSYVHVIEFYEPMMLVRTLSGTAVCRLTGVCRTDTAELT